MTGETLDCQTYPSARYVCRSQVIPRARRIRLRFLAVRGRHRPASRSGRHNRCPDRPRLGQPNRKVTGVPDDTRSPGVRRCLKEYHQPFAIFFVDLFHGMRCPGLVWHRDTFALLIIHQNATIAKSGIPSALLFCEEVLSWIPENPAHGLQIHASRMEGL